MSDTWPELPFEAWRETRATLHLYTQVVGKKAARGKRSSPGQFLLRSEARAVGQAADPPDPRRFPEA